MACALPTAFAISMALSLRYTIIFLLLIWLNSSFIFKESALLMANALPKTLIESVISFSGLLYTRISSPVTCFAPIQRIGLRIICISPSVSLKLSESERPCILDLKIRTFRNALRKLFFLSELAESCLWKVKNLSADI